MKLGYSVHESKEKLPEKCQDRAIGIETDDYGIIVVADGISSSNISHEAANMNVAYVVKLLQRPEVWDDRYDQIDMRDRIIQELKELFPADVTGYESTLTAVAVRKADGQIRCIHIGDGAVIGITENMDIFPIQYPEKILGNTSMTVCTVYYSALEYMMGLWKGWTSDTHLGSPLAGIMIFTDGAGSMLFDCPDVGAERIRRLALDMQEKEDMTELFRSLVSEIALSKYTNDDVSVAGMLFGTLKPQTKAPDAEAQPEQSDLKGVPPYALPAFYALHEGSLSVQELEEQQFCMKGRALETMMPLVQAGLAECKDGVFSLCKE